jgi:hypothetical protein
MGYKNIEDKRAYNREYMLKHKYRYYYKCTYGITEEDYNIMLKVQRGVCLVCGKAETAKNRRGGIRKLSVDHDHKTGKVRGLLCHTCNSLLGLSKESTELFLGLIAYLENHKCH